MLYLIALFLHIIGALLLAAATGIEWLCIINLRRARSIDDLRHSLVNYSRLPMIGGLSMGLILIAGIYMMAMQWTHYSGWIGVAFLGLVIMGALGGAISGRKMRTIGKLFSSEKALTPEINKHLVSEALLFSLRLRTVIFLGIILIMVAKPLPIPSLIILAVSIVIGCLPIGGRAHAPAVVQAEGK